MNVFLFGISPLYGGPQGDALVFVAEDEVPEHIPVAHIGTHFYYVALIADDDFRKLFVTGSTPLNCDFSQIAAFLRRLDPAEVELIRVSLQNVVPSPDLDYPREVHRAIKAMYQREF